MDPDIQAQIDSYRNQISSLYSPGMWTTTAIKGSPDKVPESKLPQPYSLADETAAAMKENRAVRGPYEATLATVSGSGERVYCVVDHRKEPGEGGRVTVSDSARYRRLAIDLNRKFLEEVGD